MPPPIGELDDGIASVLRSWPDDDGTRAVLARTNRELLPAVAACLDADIPFRAGGLELPLESPEIDPLLQRADAAGPASPLLVRLHDAGGPPDVLASLLAWAARYRDLVSLRDDVEAARARLARLRRDDAALTLATTHGTKGLEFDQVNILSNPMTHPQSRPSGAYSGASRFAVRLDRGSVVSGRLPPKPGTSRHDQTPAHEIARRWARVSPVALRHRSRQP